MAIVGICAGGCDFFFKGVLVIARVCWAGCLMAVCACCWQIGRLCRIRFCVVGSLEIVCMRDFNCR